MKTVTGTKGFTKIISLNVNMKSKLSLFIDISVVNAMFTIIE